MERLVAQLQRMKALEESEANLVTNILEKMPESARFSVLVSDLLHAKGRPTSLGSPAVALARWEDHEDDEGNFVAERIGAILPKSSNNVVGALEAAGGYILGKGNVSELGVGAAAGSAVYGFVHRLDNGGEMVGSEAALAAAVSGDVVDLGVGVERRTSLLGPASRLGVCAFAPTRERYPMNSALTVAPSVSSIGMVAKTVKTLEEMHQAIVAELGSEPPEVLESVRAAAMATESLGDNVKGPYDKVLQAAEAAGISFAVQDASLPPMEDLDEIHRGMLSTEFRASLSAFLAENVPFLDVDTVLARAADDDVKDCPEADEALAQDLRRKIVGHVEALDTFWSGLGADVLIGPASERLLSQCSLLGCPCAIVKIPSEPGLSVLCVGRHGADDKVLSMATLLDEALEKSS
mmetsp:Transcript_195/g.822  ORF Transcript_195/g.822 Transcript_195/m.822 type:complete len:408 (-) Transcript_195:247-1470(-)